MVVSKITGLQASPLGEISERATQFIRENPLLTGAILSATIGGTAAIIATVRRRKTRTTVSRRKAPRRKRRVMRRTKRKKVLTRSGRHRLRATTHRRPRHKGHKRVSFTTKGGKRVNFLVRKKQR